MKKIKYNKILSKYYPDKDIFLKFDALRKIRFITPAQLLYNIDLNKQFNDERSASSTYRIISDVNLCASNCLFNLTGNNSYQTIMDILYDVDNNLIYEFDEIVKETDGWFSYITDLNKCTEIAIEPKKERFLLNQNNWDIFISYSYKKDNQFKINNVKLEDGISITKITQKNISGVFYSVIDSAINITNSLKTGDIISINNGDEYFCQIIEIIDEYQYVIDQVIQYNVGANFVKVNNGVKCKYYVTKNKYIPTNIEIQKNGFAKSIYNDNHMLVLVTDLNLKDIYDYENKQLKNVYLSCIKKSNTFFNAVKSGFKFNKDTNLYNSDYINSINNLQIENNINKNDFYGHIVEYISDEDRYVIIDSVTHLFNTIDRDGHEAYENYTYNPLTLIKIRKEGNILSVNSSEGYFDGVKYLSRPVLNNSESNLHPFLNGVSYIENKITLPIYRQFMCNQDDIIEGLCETLDITTNEKTKDILC